MRLAQQLLSSMIKRKIRSTQLDLPLGMKNKMKLFQVIRESKEK